MFSFSRPNAFKPPWARKNEPPVEQIILELEGRKRHFAVTVREGRVCFQDRENPSLQWATLDSWDGSGSYLEFWRGAIAKRRIGRDVEIMRGFSGGPLKRARPYYSHLQLLPIKFRVLAKEAGGGLVREVASGAAGEAQGQVMPWMEFEPLPVSRVARPGAHIPSIFSPQWHLNFVHRDLRQFQLRLVQEHLSEEQRTLWDEGVTSKPLRLIAAALQLGLASNLPAPRIGVNDFWKAVFEGERAFDDKSVLPEAHLAGRLSLWRYSCRYVLQGEKFNLSVALPNSNSIESAHERLEAYMVLSDWLREAMPPAEVTRLLAGVKPN